MMIRVWITLVALNFTIFATTNFDYSFSHLIKFEGHEIDKSINKKDVHSRFGITRATLKRYNGRTDVENLTKAQAKDIVYKLYWIEFGLDRIIERRSALLVLDFLYNSNSTNAIKQIQKAIGNKVTGKLSVADIAKINYMGYKDFYKVYSKQRLDYMKSLKKSWSKFGRSWENRVNELGRLE